MTAATTAPMRAIVAGARWTPSPIEFCGTSKNDPLPFADGTLFKLTLAPVGYHQPDAEDRHSFTDEVTFASNVVGIDVPAALTADIEPGRYLAELFDVTDPLDPVSLIKRPVEVIQSLDQVSELGGGVSLPASASTGNTVVLVSKEVILDGQAAARVGSPRFDVVQGLTEPQKATARDNLGLASVGDLTAVRDETIQAKDDALAVVVAGSTILDAVPIAEQARDDAQAAEANTIAALPSVAQRSDRLGFDIPLYWDGDISWLVPGFLGFDPLGNVVGKAFIQPGDAPAAWVGNAFILRSARPSGDIDWVEELPQRVSYRSGTDYRLRYMNDEVDFDATRRRGVVEERVGGRDLVRYIDYDGSQYLPAFNGAVAFSKPVMQGGQPVHQVFIAHPDAALYAQPLGQAQQLTIGPMGAHVGPMVRPGMWAIGREDGTTGFAAGRADDKVGGSRTIAYIGYGESTALGSNSPLPSTTPIVNTPPSPNVVMFNGGVLASPVSTAWDDANFATLEPAREGGNPLGYENDTGIVAAAFQIARAGVDVAVYGGGHGGAQWNQINPGKQCWSNLDHAVRELVAKRPGIDVPFLDLWLAINDGLAGRTAEQFGGSLDACLTAFTDLVRDATGNASALPYLLLHQVSIPVAGKLMDTSKGILQRARANPRMLMCGIQAGAEFGDSYHMLRWGYAYTRAMKMKVFRRVFFDHLPWLDLHLAKPVWDGGQRVDCYFEGGNLADLGACIVTDDRWVRDPNGMLGLDWHDPTGSAKFVTWEQTADNRITYGLDKVPTGLLADMSVGCAYWANHGQTGQGRGRGYGVGAGLRPALHDTDWGACALTGVPLFNFPSHEDVPVLLAA